MSEQWVIDWANWRGDELLESGTAPFVMNEDLEGGIAHLPILETEYTLVISPARPANQE